ncbi:MAG: hypothetical protein AB1489_30040 [Acidobacteriota bacterium]
MKAEHNYLRERLQAASENMVSLLIAVLGIGFLLGITTNIVTEYILERSPRWLGLGVAALLTILLTIFFIWRVYSKGYSTKDSIEIVLPFQITSCTAEIRIVRPYPITKQMRQQFHGIMENDENKTGFVQEWHKAVKDGKRPFQGLARCCVKDLLVYAVLYALREYSDQTLTVKQIFIGHQWKINRLKEQKLSEPDFPLLLRENLCFQNKDKQPFKVIKIPLRLTLDVQNKDVQDNISTNKMERTEVILKSSYGTLKFTITPYAQRVSAKSREGSILYKYCGVDEQIELWLAKFYIQMSTDFGGLRIFTRDFREDFLPWVEGLFECVRNELDWKLCMERDLERMVVDLTDKMEALQQVQSQQSSVKVH